MCGVSDCFSHGYLNIKLCFPFKEHRTKPAVTYHQDLVFAFLCDSFFSSKRNDITGQETKMVISKRNHTRYSDRKTVNRYYFHWDCSLKLKLNLFFKKRVSDR